MASPFKTTSWSLIARARRSDETAREATAALCRMYWQPLYVYTRRSGMTEHEAEDIVQGFLMHVLSHDVFERADADRGRFRTFLLSALRQFMARQHRDASRMKRAPDGGVISMDIDGAEQLLTRTPGSPGTLDGPEAAFERAWALSQIDLAWRTVEAEYLAAGKIDLFRALRPLVVGQDARPVRKVAAGLSMTEGAVNVATHRLRRRFGDALRTLVAMTLESPEEIDDEISRLRQSLAGAHA